LIEAGAPGDRVLVYVEQHLGEVDPASVDVAAVSALIAMEVGGELTATQAKKVLGVLLDEGGAPADIAAKLGFEALSDDALGTAVDEVIAHQPDEWERFCTGDDKARGKLTGFFVGQVMRATKGNADGGAVTRMLAERAAARSASD
ncbi:MAG TPA: Asp-tRNA(Asn)/Glu-tRNA(Gln) amidotransferase subunit GatB, partial [Acidimicrobiales bacterium]|nr:Asp-tRNA(Asn)/Glu-tRNA(Gln) amidotransferase subunit GatB [Acidimicrobiales bacterium]